MHRINSGAWKCSECEAMYRRKRKDAGIKPELTSHQYYLLQRAKRAGDPINDVQGPVRPGHDGESDLTWMRAAVLRHEKELSGGEEDCITGRRGAYGTKRFYEHPKLAGQERRRARA